MSNDYICAMLKQIGMLLLNVITNYVNLIIFKDIVDY